MPARSFTLTLPVADLRAAVGPAADAAADKATIPILSHLLLRAGPAGLAIIGTDTDRQTETRADAEMEGRGLITVPSATLAAIAGKLPKGEAVTIAADAANLSTTIRCGRARFVLAGLDPDTFPEFAAADVDAGFPYRIELAGKVLADLINRCKFAISTEETRYYLGGIYAHVVTGDDGPRLRFVATCGRRLARVDTVHAEGLDPTMPGVIIPRAAIPDLVKLAKDADGATVALEISDRLVRLTAGTTTITSKLIDGTYPDYGRVVPTNFTRTVTAPTAELIECLERVRIISEDKTKGVRLVITDNTLAVTLKRAFDLFEGRDEVDIELDGDPLDIEFNAKFLTEILGGTGADTVRIKLVDAASAGVIEDKHGDGLFLLMPLRLGTAGAAVEA